MEKASGWDFGQMYMGPAARVGEADRTMTNPFTAKNLAPQINRAREARRNTARQRQYQCTDCGFERRSWVDLRSCPSCGSILAQAANAARALL